jgi:penicillin-binding protein 2
LQDKTLKPQRNRATQEIYAPGSIFKVVTAMACLEAGVVDPADVLNNPGFIMVGRQRIKDLAPAGEYDFKQAFTKSSNTYFIHYGLLAGMENIARLGHRLHLGERCELPTLQDSGGDFPSERAIRSHWLDGDTANLCIGQGPIAVTPIQMAVMISAVANGGKVFWPRLVDRVEPAEALSGEETTRYPSGRVRDTLGVSERTLNVVREAMVADVEEGGTGKRALIDGFRVCGKTGTAEIKQGARVVDHTTWFASYGPFESPRYTVVVMVESGSSGGGTCAPIAKQIYEALLKREKLARPHADAIARTF